MDFSHFGITEGFKRGFRTAFWVFILAGFNALLQLAEKAKINPSLSQYAIYFAGGIWLINFLITWLTTHEPEN
jgi:hypothetical protein